MYRLHLLCKGFIGFLVLALFISCFPIAGYAQDTEPPQVERWQVYELSFEAHSSYSDPFNDVKMDATFTDPVVL